MKFFKKSYDGGPDSGVTGYWLIEWKRGFSIILLHFSPGSREAFHSHAFNAVTWWLKGRVHEVSLVTHAGVDGIADKREWTPSIRPKWTPRKQFHKVLADHPGAWAISFRGPWDKTWQEHKNGDTITLTSGRIPIIVGDARADIPIIGAEND